MPGAKLFARLDLDPICLFPDEHEFGFVSYRLSAVAAFLLFRLAGGLFRSENFIPRIA
jgi:hypothetical protein